MVRLANLSNVMALRLFSSAVAKRFPTYRHLVLVSPPGPTSRRASSPRPSCSACRPWRSWSPRSATRDSLVLLTSIPQTSWAPVLWAQGLLRQAWDNGFVKSDHIFLHLIK